MATQRPTPPEVTAVFTYPKWNNLIRGAARRIARQLGFSSTNDDVAQDVFARLWQQRDRVRHHPGKHEAFIRTAIAQTAANLQRQARAEKRDPKRVRSLHGSDAFNLERCRRRCGVQRNPSDQSELAHDLAEVLRTLPKRLRDMAIRLMTSSVAQTARTLGIPRTTIYRDIRSLRRRLQAAGLHHYLGGVEPC